MQDAQLTHFQTKLLQMREDIASMRAVRDEAGETVELDQTRNGRLTRMDALQSQAMAKATAQRADLQLKKIEGALLRIENGEYGYCIRCAEPIAEARLNVNPTALKCIHCAD